MGLREPDLIILLDGEPFRQYRDIYEQEKYQKELRKKYLDIAYLKPHCWKINANQDKNELADKICELILKEINKDEKG